MAVATGALRERNCGCNYVRIKTKNPAVIAAGFQLNQLIT
jgi:hypothetical protein